MRILTLSVMIILKLKSLVHTTPLCKGFEYKVYCKRNCITYPNVISTDFYWNMFDYVMGVMDYNKNTQLLKHIINYENINSNNKHQLKLKTF
jgi:hypothetical protein